MATNDNELVRVDDLRPRPAASSSTECDLIACAEGMTYPDKIGLDKMGMKKPEVGKLDSPLRWAQDLDPELDFATPDYAPPRESIWDDPSNPSLNLTGRFRVVRVDSPDAFWAQNFRRHMELPRLEQQMTVWYNDYWEANPSGLKHRYIILGGFYAAYISDYEAWVRVRIQETAVVDNGETCLVYLLDYGCTRIVELFCIMFLRHAYNQLPIQAFKMEAYDEGDCDFTSDDLQKFKGLEGRLIYAIPLWSREEIDAAYKTLRVVLMSRQVKSEMEIIRQFDFYNPYDRVKLDKLIEAIREFQQAISKTEPATTKVV